MAELQARDAQCNTCGGERKHELWNKIERQWSEHIGQGVEISGGDTYFVLECRGCEGVKLLKRSWFSEETDENGQPITSETYYPPSIFRPHPRWLGSLDREWHITKLLKETYQALQNDAPSLAAMGIRAAIEAIMVDKVGDQGSFRSNLSTFVSQGYISTVQRGVLEAALEIGHASIHRGFIPKPSQIELALDITENLVHVLYLLEHNAAASITGIPKRGA